MDKMTPTELKIKRIELAIERALKCESKIDEIALSIPMLGSLNIRHLLNNLGELGTHFLDVGPHKGGSSCSAIYKNPLQTITAIDCFASDDDPKNFNDRAQPQFLDNVKKCLHHNTQFTFIKSDAFDVDLAYIPFPIDFYSYDASHTIKDQEMALTYYLPALADEFIYCCDDYGWQAVKDGTERGIELSNLEILFQQEFKTEKEYDNDSWWTGYYIALLKKKLRSY